MATVYNNRRDATFSVSPNREGGYSTYQEPDTRVPPRARPVMKEISVSGVPIAEADILAEAQNHPAGTPGEAVLAAARALVVRELLLEEARRLGIESEPDTGPDGRTETEEDAVIRALVAREVSAPSATEAECLRFYEANPNRFRSGAIYEACHILTAAPPDDAEARQQARALSERLLSQLAVQPSAFGALAKQYSDCPSREHGGNLGQVTRGGTVVEFERALETMAEGDISTKPVESRFGFHIIRLDRKIPGKVLPFGLVHERISVWLEAAAWSKAVSQYISVLAAEADIRGIDIGAPQGPLVQ